MAGKNAAEIAELYRQGLGNALQVADANVRLFEAEVEVARQRQRSGPGAVEPARGTRVGSIR